MIIHVMQSLYLWIYLKMFWCLTENRYNENYNGIVAKFMNKKFNCENFETQHTNKFINKLNDLQAIKTNL